MAMRHDMRLLLAGMMALAVAGPLPAVADDASLGEQIVGTMVTVFGDHPGVRTNHTKGIVVTGRFTPSAAGEALTAAPIFKAGADVAVTARFSDATGVPSIPDGSPDANPHGLGLRLESADGTQMDIVANSLKFFPVKTGEEFLALLQAVAASGPGAAKPTPIEQFIAAHPNVVKAIAAVATPASFARETYNGINTFVFVDGAGGRHPFRFRIVPVAGEAHLTGEEAAAKAPDFLVDGLRAELAQGPARFRLLAQLAGEGDDLADPSVAWPEDRETVDLGEIVLTAAAPDSAAAEKDLMLLPGNLPDGVEPSDDPMIDVRNESYAVSFTRRAQ